MAKPTKIKQLTGTARKDRLPKNEMQPPLLEDTTTPTVLTNKFARIEWEKQTKILNELGMLVDTDTSLLIAYCIEVGNYFTLKERVGDSITFNTPNGHEMVLPEVTEANKSLQNMIKLSSLFGFNPVARTKIEMPTKKPSDNIGGLL